MPDGIVKTRPSLFYLVIRPPDGPVDGIILRFFRNDGISAKNGKKEQKLPRAEEIGDAGSPLRRRINSLQDELTRYQKFAKLYRQSRYRRSHTKEKLAPAKEALAIYGVRENAAWHKTLDEPIAPALRFVRRISRP